MSKRSLSAVVLLLVALLATGCIGGLGGQTKVSESFIEIPLSRQTQIASMGLEPFEDGAFYSEYDMDLEHNEGDIIVTVWDDETIDYIGIRVTKTAYGEEQEIILQKTDLDWDWLDNHLDVATLVPDLTNDQRVTVALEIRFPQGHLINLRSESSEGDVWVTKIIGSVEARTSNGNISVSDIESDAILYALTSNGDVYLENIIAEQTEGETSNGHITVRNVVGPLLVDSSNGNIDVDGTNGRLEVEISNGEITLSGINLVDSGLIKGSDTDITLDLASVRAGDYEVLTSNGDIVIRFPQGIKMFMQAEVGNGVITSNFLPVGVAAGNFEGNWPDSESDLANFTVETSNGNIALDVKDQQ